MKAVEWICTHNSIGASCGSQKLRAHFAGLASELRREELAANKAVPAQNVPEV